MDAEQVSTTDMVDAFHRMQVERTRVAQHVALANGINATDLRVLEYLAVMRAALSEASPTMVGEYLQMSRGATTAVLDRLEQKGFVERTRNPLDRRGILLALTATGCGAVDRMRQAYAQAIDASVPEDYRIAFLVGCRSLGNEFDVRVSAEIAARDGAATPND